MVNDSRRRIAPIDVALVLCFVTLCLSGTRAEDVAGAGDITPLADDTEYDMTYKLETGEVLRYTVDHRAAVRSTIDETSQEAQTKTESVKAWKVTDVLPSGEIEFMNVVERVHMLNQLPDRAPTEYDSQQDKTPPPGYEDAARAIGVPLSVVWITPRGKVVSRKAKLEQSAAEHDAQIVLRLPEEPVAIGDTWDEPFDVTVDLADGGTKAIQTRRHHKLTGVSTGIASIEVTYQVLSPIDAAIEAQLVQRLMKGTVRFDVEAGRIASQRFEVDQRVLGFAGPTSSMHYVMSMEERLLEEEVAEKTTTEEQIADATAADEQQTRTRPRTTRRTSRSPRSASRNIRGGGSRSVIR